MSNGCQRHREPNAERSRGTTEQAHLRLEARASRPMTVGGGRSTAPARWLGCLALLATLAACVAPPPPRVIYQPLPSRPFTLPPVAYSPLPPAPATLAPTPVPAEPAMPSSIRPEPPAAPDAPAAAVAVQPVQKVTAPETPAVPLMGFRPMRGQKAPGV